MQLNFFSYLALEVLSYDHFPLYLVFHSNVCNALYTQSFLLSLQDVHREMKIRANNGEEYYLMDVLAQVFKYLKNELIVNTLQHAGYDLEATDFDWVIAIPPTWGSRANGKQIIKEAGHKVTLPYLSS